MLAAERRKYLDNLVPEVARIFRLNQDSRCEEALALVSELQARGDRSATAG